MKLTGAQALIKSLEMEGVEVMFGLPGGCILPAYDPLDIAYVGTVMLEAAGLPLSAAQRERKRLMVACEGRYFGCEPRS